MSDSISVLGGEERKKGLYRSYYALILKWRRDTLRIDTVMKELDNAIREGSICLRCRDKRL